MINKFSQVFDKMYKECRFGAKLKTADPFSCSKFQQSADVFYKSPNSCSFEKKLFPDGISNLKFKQGADGADLNDCYFLSTVKALSLNENGSEKLIKAISLDKDGTYKINLCKNNKFESIVLTQEEIRNGVGGYNVSTNSKGLKILETAFAKFINPTKFSNDSQSISGIWGVQARDAMYSLTGIVPFEVASSVSSPVRIKQSAFSECATKFLDDFAENPNSFSVVVGTAKYVVDMDEVAQGYKFISKHAYTLAGVDSVAKIVTVIDPYDSEKLIKISYDDFVKYFNSITGVDFSGKYNKIAKEISEKYKPNGLLQK